MKKIICLVLAFMLILPSLAVSAREYLPLYEDMDTVFRFDVGDFVEGDREDEKVVTPAMKRMQFLENIGIWDDADKNENDLVTLTEFSIIMSRLRLGSYNALEDVYKNNENKENATYKNAYAYLIEALGYIHMCKEYNNTDESLLIVASQIDLLTEKPENINAYITRGELSALIIKALRIDMCVIEYTDYGYSYNVAEGKNLLNSVHGIHEINGFVNAVEGLAVQGGSEVRKGCIQIDRRDVFANGLVLDEFLGARVRAYATYDENKDLYNIISIDYADDYQPVEIDFSDINSIRGNTIIYTDAEYDENELELSGLKNIVMNGEVIRSLEEVDYRANEGKILITSSEKDGEYDTAIVSVYHYFISSYTDAFEYRLGINSGQKYNGLNYVQLSDKAVLRITVDGVVTPLEKIPSNAAFRVFQCASTGYTEIVVITGKLTGSVEAKYDEVVQIDGKEYILTKDILAHIEYCKEHPEVLPSQKIKELEVGLSTIFYVFENKIVSYSATNEYKYGYLKSVSESRTSIDPDLTFRILTQDGEWIDFNVVRNIEVDGKPNVSREELIYKVSNDLDIINNVVRYKANGKNELVALDTYIEDPLYENNDNGFTDDIHFEATVDLDLDWVDDWFSLSSEYFLSPDITVFIAPAGETNEDKFRVISGSQLPGTSLPMKFYNANEYNQVRLALCTVALDQGTGGDSESAGPFYYVESIRKTVIDADNMEYGYRIMAKRINPKDTLNTAEAIGNLVDTSFTLSDDLLDKNFVLEGEFGYDDTKKIEVGDLIEATVIGGEAISWSMSLKGGVVGQLSSPDDGINDYKGRKTFDVYAKGKIVALDPASRIVLIESEGVKHPAYMNVTAVIDPSTNKIRLVSAADFREGDIVYTYIRYGRMYFMVKNS